MAEEDKECGHKDNLCSCQLLRGERESATIALCSRVCGLVAHTVMCLVKGSNKLLRANVLPVAWKAGLAVWGIKHQSWVCTSFEFCQAAPIFCNQQLFFCILPVSWFCFQLFLFPVFDRILLQSSLWDQHDLGEQPLHTKQ